jgi:hypothetical protein
MHDNDVDTLAEVMAATLAGIREFERTARGARLIDNIQAQPDGKILVVRMCDGTDIRIELRRTGVVPHT